MPRICLALFALACVGYYFVCRDLFLLSGLGFLAGFLPALPATVWFARMARQRPNGIGALLALVLSFSVYFWVSASIILWRMGR